MSSVPFPETVPDLLRQRVERSPEEAACYRRAARADWRATRWSALSRQVCRISAGFREIGLAPGDRLAILARTSLEWQIAELAGLDAGAVIVGVDPHAPAEQVEYVLRHSQARGLVLDDGQQAAKVPEALQASFRFVVTLRGPGVPGQTNWHSWQRILEADVPADRPQGHRATADAPAALIYTSGTTGRPKAIEYSHRQLLVACGSILRAFPQIGPDATVLCWLPMAHLFQRMINLAAIECGARTYFVEDPREIAACLREVQPSVFVGVPRFYERLYEGIQERVSRLPRWLAALVRAALATGAAYAQCQRAGKPASRGLRIRHCLMDRLFLRRMRGAVGRRIKFMITGSAPTPPRLLEFFHGLGILVLEAYGVSENAVPMAANRPQCYRFGSVGRPFEENEIRFADDGEILVRGPGVFRGYDRDEEGENHFTPEGFYRTGDIGHLDPDGFLFLSGRKAEIIKTSTGRRISPARIEALYAQSPYIDQVVVIGNGRKYLVGLIVVRRSTLERRFAESGVALPAAPEVVADMPEVRRAIQAEIVSLGGSLASHERILNFAILPGPLSVERGELTPTLKIRRDRVAALYADLLEQVYRQPPFQDPSSA